MHRLTARLLILLLLVGTFAPVALAISAPAPHACCARKPIHDRASHGAEFAASDCGRHDCCSALAVCQSAQTRQAATVQASDLPVAQPQEMQSFYFPSVLGTSHSGRAPPTHSIA